MNGFPGCQATDSKLNNGQFHEGWGSRHLLCGSWVWVSGSLLPSVRVWGPPQDPKSSPCPPAHASKSLESQTHLAPPTLGKTQIWPATHLSSSTPLQCHVSARRARMQAVSCQGWWGLSRQCHMSSQGRTWEASPQPWAGSHSGRITSVLRGGAHSAGGGLCWGPPWAGPHGDPPGDGLRDLYD